MSWLAGYFFGSVYFCCTYFATNIFIHSHADCFGNSTYFVLCYVDTVTWTLVLDTYFFNFFFLFNYFGILAITKVKLNTL